MRDNGGPAFPVDTGTSYSRGMSLRDWFAGQAMAALISGGLSGGNFIEWGDAARGAYIAADAMLEARK